MSEDDAEGKGKSNVEDGVWKIEDREDEIERGRADSIASLTMPVSIPLLSLEQQRLVLSAWRHGGDVSSPSEQQNVVIYASAVLLKRC